MCQVQREWRQVRFCVPEDERFVFGSIYVSRHSNRTDDRFIAKEISRAELATMETFAPAYFDYMSSCFTAKVRSLPITLSPADGVSPASYAPCQDLWMFQGYVENDVVLWAGKTQGEPAEYRCYGKPVLRSSVLEGESEAPFVYISGIFG